MRKMFVEAGSGGDSAQFWNHAWDEIDLELEILRMRQGLDPLVKLVARHVSPGMRVLEAGCGSGRVLAFLREIGCKAVGLDFAIEALTKARERLPSLPVVAGDVTLLPFNDASFDRIVSIGVVEHFEEGPIKALLEHRRVLRQGGLLLISVPRLSPLKRWTDWRQHVLRSQRRYKSWRGLLVERVNNWSASRHPIDGFSFYQYEVSRRTLLSALKGTGFHPIAVTPTAISLGLRDVGWFRKGFDFVKRTRAGGAPPAHSIIQTGAASGIPALPALRRLLSSEQFRGPLERVFIYLLRLAAGHIYFVVAMAENPKDGLTDEGNR